MSVFQLIAINVHNYILKKNKQLSCVLYNKIFLSDEHVVV